MCVILFSNVLLIKLYIKLSRGWVFLMILNQKLSQAAKNNNNVSYNNYIEILIGELFVVFLAKFQFTQI